MSFHYLTLLIAGAAAGGLINGLAGFGTALFALGFWLQIMPPMEAVSITVIMSVVSGLQGVVIVRKAIADNWTRLARFLVPAILGVPLGTSILAVIDAGTLKISIALFLILYGAFFIVRRSLPLLDRSAPASDCAVGFAGGILGGAASLSGVLPTMYCAMRPWPKNEQRAVMQPFNVAVLALTAIVLAIRGSYTPHVLMLIAIALPVAMIAAQVGIVIYHRLDDRQFRLVLVSVMFISGLLLLARELPQVL